MVSLSFTEELSERLIREANEAIEKCAYMSQAQSTTPMGAANTTNANASLNTSRQNNLMDGKCPLYLSLLFRNE